MTTARLNKDRCRFCVPRYYTLPTLILTRLLLFGENGDLGTYSIIINFVLNEIDVYNSTI